MPTRKELQALAKLRLKEAETLFDRGLYDGAAYLAGYVVEFALKAKICRLLSLPNYPPPGKVKGVYAVRDFDQLLLLSGLHPKLREPANINTYANWLTVTPWNPERRYEPKGTYSQLEAQQILDAVRVRPDGVLTWIMRYW